MLQSKKAERSQTLHGFVRIVASLLRAAKVAGLTVLEKLECMLLPVPFFPYTNVLIIAVYTDTPEENMPQVPCLKSKSLQLNQREEK